MQLRRRDWLRRGARDGIPICLGYFAVALTLGIAARNAGIAAGPMTLMSLLNNTSAGEFVAVTLIAAGASYWEMLAMQVVANARYLLMSCALSQKLRPDTPLWRRLLLGFGVTDEIFGISISVDGYLDPFYTFGAMLVAVPGWASGTCLGVILGNILPARVVSALSVGLYGMFIAVFVPPARKSRRIAVLVLISFALSYAATKLPFLADVSSGLKIIALTVVISLAAALLLPVSEEAQDAA